MKKSVTVPSGVLTNSIKVFVYLHCVVFVACLQPACVWPCMSPGEAEDGEGVLEPPPLPTPQPPCSNPNRKLVLQQLFSTFFQHCYYYYSNSRTAQVREWIVKTSNSVCTTKHSSRSSSLGSKTFDFACDSCVIL